MAKLIKFTPFLLAILPVIFLYDQNKNEVAYQVIWWPLFFVILLAGIVFFIVSYFEKNSTKAILFTSLAIIILLYYGFVYDIAYGTEFYGLVWGRHKYLFPFWILISAVGLYRLKITKINLDNLLQAICFSAFIMVLISVWGSVYYNLTKPDIKKDLVNGESAMHLDDKQKINLSGPLPDIYYIIPDAYAGPKVLEKYFNFNNNEFYKHLEKSGFKIAQNSKSSYPNTFFSISSTLNMERINYLTDILGKDSNDYNSIKQIFNDNKVLRQLQSAGYKYVHFDSDYTTFLEGDPLAVETPLDIFSRILLKFTILRPFGGRYGFKEEAINDRLRDNILTVLESLEGTAVEAGPPKFVFAHITSPHGPYVFNRDGGKVNGQFDNNVDEMNFYIDQLIFINKRLTAIVDKILANSKTPPIIIIQSDHGFYVPREVLTGPDYDVLKFNVRMQNFSAYYLPKNRCKSSLPQSINAVNTFRFVFDQCFGTRYGLLENESYYFTDQSRPYDLIKVDYSKDPI